MIETLLPNEWIATTLKDICILNPKNDLDDELDVGFLPMSGVPVNFGEKNVFETKQWSEVKKGYTHFADGDTIFAKITPCFENSKAAIIENFPNGYGSGSTEYFVLRPIGRLVNPNLLLGLVRTSEFLREGASNMSGSVGHKRVPKEFVENYIFPLPPLAEQQQIAQKLDELLAQVDTLKTRLDAIPNILKRFRQSVLAAAVSGRLTEEWRGSDEYSVLNLDLEKIEIAQKWVVVKLENILSNERSLCYGVVQPGDEVESGVPLVRVCDIYGGKIDWSGLRTISTEIDFQYRRSKISLDDVLVTIVGAIGRVGIVDREIDANIARAVARISTNADLILPRFLHLWLSSPMMQWWLVNSSKEVARKTLNLKELKEASVAVPPLEEQTEIVRRVEQLFAYADQLEQRVKDAQARVNHLTQSILAKAFRGELTAEWRAQNPELISGENSAAALLERIKAEREATAKPKRKVKS